MASYEEERERQIRENSEFLASLGIEKLVVNQKRVAPKKRVLEHDGDNDDYRPSRDFGIRKRSKTISYREDDYYRAAAPVKMKSAKSKSGLVKRRADAGHRIIGGRVYDSQLGKTCHQCRQKTMDKKIACSNPSCNLMMDYRCLINRYNEDANVIDHSEWTCPKCRNICNCSFCMKKRGKRPTGQISTFIKLNGIEAAKKAIMTDNISPTVIFPMPPRRHRSSLDGLDCFAEFSSDDDSDETLTRDNLLTRSVPTRQSKRLIKSNVREKLAASVKLDLDQDSDLDLYDMDDDMAAGYDTIWHGWQGCPLDINCIVLI
ncbi:hypothetical protein COEREDRAFT_82361 [Coemansia reversa NRRL 1564]|uniref:Zinc-finger domain-containing protein n=1 Tax=Coemansia reversa (strain ATCC 12441 / NRRL 1564) TaxID=763665 RepID=A0A2G5B886_COERN|nr:hypothetical protein COEREDRAFT_82361 [Coemansia reversa NRRL 1564]|eukprot:PIA14937.1 hypothetical protein COEREDRAFT_82361 [Coemansia reversa NRRL 1564]